jgi:uncharacterized lipoprotein YddW (UPF0748 family)
MSCADVIRAGATTRVRAAAGCLIVAAALLQAQPHVRAEPRADLRVLSIPAAGLTAADTARRLSDARDSGVNTIFIPISLDGETDAASAAIDAVIRGAHDRGLRVHAAVQIMVAARAGALPSSRDHVIYRHPEWLMVPRSLAIEMQSVDPRSPDYIGRLTRWTRAQGDRVDGLYLSPLQPEATAHMADAVRRIVSRHAVDGIHFDGVRFPAREFDYGVRSLDAFRGAMRRTLPASERTRVDEVDAIDPFGYPDELSDEWRRFRATRVTSLIAQLRAAVRSVRPETVVSATAVAGADLALSEYLQDWRTWVDNGFVDALAEHAAAATTLLFSYEALVDAVTGRAPATATPVGTASP